MKQNYFLFILFNLLLQSYLYANNAMPDKKPQVPVGLHIKTFSDHAQIKWTDPSLAYIFRHDNGIAVDAIGFKAGTEKSVIGTVYKDALELYTISWFLNESDTLKDVRVNLFVFAIDKDGKPTKEILYSEKNISCRYRREYTHHLQIPIITTNGCFIGLSVVGKGMLSLGIDDGQSAEWPFIKGVNFVTIDYTSSSFKSSDEQGFKNNFMIRAMGLQNTTPPPTFSAQKSFSRSISQIEIPFEASLSYCGSPIGFFPNYKKAPSSLQYKLWRMKEGEEKEPNLWVKLTENTIDTNFHSDFSWNDLKQGSYKYGVQAILNGQESDVAISFTANKDMLTSVQIKTDTEIDNLKAVGAIVTLTESIEGGTHSYSAKIDSLGNALFPAVWKSIYVLEISYIGFNTFKEENLSLNKESEYIVGPYRLEEIIETPFALQLLKTNTPFQRKITWNNLYSIFEDVEGHEDFSLNSVNKIAWSYIDADKGTPYGIENCTFPNMSLPCAYIVFNPEKTKPSMANLPAALPHSGYKYFAAFSNMPSSGLPSPANNDFLISPELAFNADFEFSFWGKSYLDSYLESIKVVYSTGGKEVKDFTHDLTPQAVVVPNEWTEYHYNIPAQAKYIAINYISQDKFIFMLDDIRIGEKPSGAKPMSFQVFLDGVKIDDVTPSEYLLENLSKGNHKIEIIAAYKSKVSDTAFLTFVIADTCAKIKGKLINQDGFSIVNAKLKISGDYEYEIQVKTDGSFEFPAVYAGSEYVLSITANGFQRYTKSFDMSDQDIDFGDITLMELPVKPGMLMAKEIENNVEISWVDPHSYLTFRHDDGTIIGGLGSNKGTDKTIVGAVYRESALISNITWMTASEGKSSVNVFVFDLDPNGNPTTKILFSKKNVSNIGLKWNTLNLSESVSCPRGFLLGISGTNPGNVGLGADAGLHPDWPFIPNVNYLITDYTDGQDAFKSLDVQFTKNVMIRSEGVLANAQGSPLKSIEAKGEISYNVWRLNEGKESDTNTWNLLTKNKITQTSLIDETWSDLPKGAYKYAVKSNYSNGDVSEAAFSSVIGKQLTTRILIKAICSDGKSPKGAKVNLKSTTNASLSYTVLMDTAAQVIFEEIETGIYTLSITLDKYAILSVQDLNFMNEKNYTLGPFNLIEAFTSPNNLKVVDENIAGQRLFTWENTKKENNSTMNGDEVIADFFHFITNAKEIVIYEIFLDSVKVGETAEEFYRFSDLKKGRHTAGIRIRNGSSYSKTASCIFNVSETVDNSKTNLSDSQISIYPNPVSGGYFTIKHPNMRIKRVEISNSFGARVYTTSSSLSSYFEMEIKLFNMASGLYFVKIFTEDKISYQKIIIKN